MIKCEICGRKFSSLSNMSKHIWRHGISRKEYYDKYIRKIQEGFCVVCQNETNLISIIAGYSKYCSRKCISQCKEIKLKKQKTCIKNYGVSNPQKSKIIKKRTIQTCIVKYGTDNGSKNQKIKNKISKQYHIKTDKEKLEIKKKIKNTNLKKYGTENVSGLKQIKDKIEKTCLKKYGTKSSNQNEEVKKKKIQTSLKKFGTENPFQNEEVKKKYTNTCILRYNVSHVSSSPKIKEKKKNTCLKKYGVENPFLLESVRNKCKQTMLKKYGVEYPGQTKYSRKISRLNAIRNIEIQKLNGEPLVPCIGKIERKCLNLLESLISYKIIRQHPTIGFFPDGYIVELNLVIEFDEENHFHNNQLSKKDMNRQQEIKEELKCRFFRIREKNWIQNQSQIIEQFEQEIIKNV